MRIVTALDAGFVGFELDPLDKLSLSGAEWEHEPVPFDPAVHLKQHDTTVTVLPWTRSPLNALKAISSMPFTDLENDGVDLSESDFLEREGVLMRGDRSEIAQTGVVRCVPTFDSSLFVIPSLFCVMGC